MFLIGRRYLQKTRVIVEARTFWKIKCFIVAQLKLASCRYNQDSPRACRRMNGTRRLEDEPADEPNHERGSCGAEERQDDKDDDEKSGKTTSSADSHTYQSARTLSLSDCRDSGEISPNLSNLNLGEFFCTNFLPIFICHTLERILFFFSQFSFQHLLPFNMTL